MIGAATASVTPRRRPIPSRSSSPVSSAASHGAVSSSPRQAQGSSISPWTWAVRPRSQRDRRARRSCSRRTRRSATSSTTAGRADPAQRPQFPGARAAERRRRHAAGRHARRRAAAGRAAANVGGQRSGHNIYLLDGVKVTDELFNNLVINPSVDSIQEFKIQKSQYPAEFGGKASALINVATRAGTNAFHGSAVRVLPQRHVRRAQLLRSARPADAAAAAESVRRRVRRAAASRSDVLLRQLRRPAHSPIADADLLGAVAGRARRRLRRLRRDLRSARPIRRRRVHAVRRQSDSRRTASIRSPRLPAARAARRRRARRFRT